MLTRVCDESLQVFDVNLYDGQLGEDRQNTLCDVTRPVIRRSGTDSSDANLSVTAVPGESDHEWPKTLRGTVLNNVISYRPERFTNGGQIWESVWSRCVLGGNGKVMS